MEEKVQEVRSLDQSKFLDFEKVKTQPITLEQLKRTHVENDIKGNPLMGMYHYVLFETIINMARECNYGVEVYDMFAAQNRDRYQQGVVINPQVESIYGERAVEAFTLRRVFANIRLTDFEDAETTTNLAIAYHQKGIQVGFGPMVRICHNQCLLCPDQYAATYAERGRGTEGVELPHLIEIVRAWFLDAQRIVDEQRAKIERMKQIAIGANELFQIIGMLTAIRVKVDTTNKELREDRQFLTYPLNQSQINKLTEMLLLTSKRNGRVTVWDLYNTATEMYKPNEMDIPSALPQNRQMVRFIDEMYFS